MTKVPNQPASGCCKEQAICRGTVEVVSDPLHLAMGRVIFVTLLREADGQSAPRPSHFVVVSDAIVSDKVINENDVMIVYRAKAFTWKNSEGQTGCLGIWHLISSAADYEVHSKEEKCLDKCPSSQYEAFIEGIVRGFHSGVVFLSPILTKENNPLQTDSASSSSKQSVMKVLVHHLHEQCLSLSWLSVSVGSHVHLTRLLPIHLHGRLQAYAYTVRSRIALVGQTAAISGQERAPICGALCGSSMQELSYTYTAWRSRGLMQLQRLCMQTPPLSQHMLNLAHLETLLHQLASPLPYRVRRQVQEEFADPWHLDLVTGRAGHHADTLSSLLPLLESLKDLMARLHKHRGRLPIPEVVRGSIPYPHLTYSCPSPNPSMIHDPPTPALLLF
ncbi:hypothetical protein EON65_30785, partial [archaeon]